MAEIDYIKLYSLQDKVLDLLFQENTELYLTGETCLHRFYFEERYSNDLDFFTNFSETFAYLVRETLHHLAKSGLEISKMIEAKDFIRVTVERNQVALQLDFVNDRVKRFGEINQIKGYRLDNLQNILSNKITAVISRDDPKDIFDIWVLNKNLKIDWRMLLSQAKEKAFFQKDELIYRLETFPLELLKKLKTKKIVFPEQLKLNKIVEAIKAADF